MYTQCTHGQLVVLHCTGEHQMVSLGRDDFGYGNILFGMPIVFLFESVRGWLINL